MNSYFKRFPELEEFAKVLLKEIDARIYNALRPANEVVLDDIQLQEKLQISKRTTASMRDERLIGYSKPSGKVYYTLQDLLDYVKRNRIEPNLKDLENK